MTEERTLEISSRVCPDCGAEFSPVAEFCPHDGTKLQEADSGSDDPLIGKEIDGRFRIESKIGEGGMGRIYRGRQLSIDRDVAIKVVHDKPSGDPASIDRFWREARVLSESAHANVVDLLDFGEAPELQCFYLVMEHIDGVEVADLISEKRLDVALATEIVIQICEGLSEAHADGVVHRDLKPENLMLRARVDGRLEVKVLDFGIAQGLEDDEKLTKTGMLVGTLDYLAPERITVGESSLETDIYGVGCIFFEMLTGRVPFESDKPVNLLSSHVNDPVPRLPTEICDADQHRRLTALLEDMMSKATEDRPSTVLEVRDRLEELRDEFDHQKIRLSADTSGFEVFEPWLASPFGRSVIDDASSAEVEEPVAQRTGLGDEASEAGMQPSFASDVENSSGGLSDGWKVAGIAFVVAGALLMVVMTVFWIVGSGS